MLQPAVWFMCVYLYIYRDIHIDIIIVIFAVNMRLLLCVCVCIKCMSAVNGMDWMEGVDCGETQQVLPKKAPEAAQTGYRNTKKQHIGRENSLDKDLKEEEQKQNLH